VPTYHFIDGADRIYGVGDILVNYRYQALYEDDSKPAFAPRFSLILPTGSRRRSTGDNVVGYQWNLPFSKKLGPRFAAHANFGLTYLPHVHALLDGPTRQLSAPRSLVSYNVGASAVYALSPGFRTAVVNEEKLQIVLGAAMPVGLSRKADNHGAFLYFSVEHDLF
jgi:hypothetical protein